MAAATLVGVFLGASKAETSRSSLIFDGVGKFPFLPAQLTFPFAYWAICCLNNPVVGALCSGNGVPPRALQGQVWASIPPQFPQVLPC